MRVRGSDGATTSPAAELTDWCLHAPRLGLLLFRVEIEIAIAIATLRPRPLKRPHNEDRNLGNILFMPDWKMVLIDHTRSFRLWSELLKPSAIR